MIFKIVKFLIALLFISLLILIFKPVPKSTEDKSLSAWGAVGRIYETKDQDIFIQLINDNRSFYINRGIESGLSIDSLKEKLLGKEVTIHFPKYWTPLDPYSKSRHISKLATRNEIYYSEY